jgi:hypothetical protein
VAHDCIQSSIFIIKHAFVFLIARSLHESVLQAFVQTALTARQTGSHAIQQILVQILVTAPSISHFA